MNLKLTVKELSFVQANEIVALVKQLDEHRTTDYLVDCMRQMFDFENYSCLGLYEKGNLIGLCSCWVSVKFYSGKQLEVDNVIIDHSYQGKGYGTVFFSLIEQYAKEKQCLNVELNTYVENHRSHKFYFAKGYSIKGFHFLKKLP